MRLAAPLALMPCSLFWVYMTKTVKTPDGILCPSGFAMRLWHPLMRTRSQHGCHNHIAAVASPENALGR